MSRAKLTGALRVFGALALLTCEALASQSAQAQTSPAPYTAGTRYDLQRRVVGTIAPDPDGAGPQKYAATRNTYDAAGNLIRIENGELASWQSETVAPSAWSGFTIFQTLDFSFDAMGRKIKETVKGADGVAAALTQYRYDQLGRLICTAERLNPAAFASPPSDACALGPMGSFGPDRITKSDYDVAGQVLKLQKAYGVTVANGFPSTLQQDYLSYSYTANGRPETITDANGNKASYTYDSYDRQSQWNFPHKTIVGAVSSTDYEAYGYDSNGNRTSLRKRDGSIIGYTYDGLNRAIVKDLPGGNALDVYYGYDLSGRQTFARYGSASGTGITNLFDGFGRLASTTNNMGSTVRTLSYAYDADNNRKRLTLPDGSFFTYDYDGLNRLTSINEGGSSPVVSSIFDNQGRISSQTRGAVTTTLTYDPVARPQSWIDDLQGTTSDVTSTFSYNPVGQITTKSRSNNSYSFQGYVSVNRAYAVNGLNQYTTAGPATFSYDNNGNLTGDGTSSFTYDVENRLIGMTGIGTLKYDPVGRLWQVILPSKTIEFSYDGDALVMEANGGTLYRYVHGPGIDDPMLEYSGSGYGNRYSYQPDYQGSVVSVADVSGSAIRINSYDEYGIGSPGNYGRFQYTGQAWLSELGIYYYKARMYSPTLGRFLQTDPIGYQDQANLYAYARNDPIDNTDPTGTHTGSLFDNVVPNGLTINGVDLLGRMMQMDQSAGQSATPFSGSPPGAQTAPATAPAAETAAAAARTAAGTVVRASPILLALTLCGDTPCNKTVYVTYTKTNQETGQVYSGRSSMTVSKAQPVTRALGQLIVSRRDSGHNMPGFGPAVLDKVSSDRSAIRGREQQLIDYNGGAQSMGGWSANKINGISNWNPFRSSYMSASSAAFGALPNRGPNK